ncbi:MAG: AAA family ATPase, partial [Pseudomonadota bacterium]
MRFSKLRLTGFKSFVDPTDLIIADGLTGVVGPNGCGKSNLLEALRWVMGENRPTAMRGGGMDDVIFAGAATRPARNFAEVALHLDNSERLAPSGFNDHDTLEIVRRITRDVGSAYKVGAKDVRARDVQMLFADASTGAHSPALVRQGQIAELINAKPKSRRRILEEAAGISGLYQRRHEAELKLKSAEANLARVDDVIEQLATQLAQLARQAKQAARYRDIGDALRRAEGMLLYRRWREADEARAAAEETLLARVTEAAQAESAARTEAKRRASAEEGLPPLREEQAIAAAVVQRFVVQRDGLSEEAARAETLIETLTARVEQLARDIEREGALNRDAGESIARLEEEARALEAQADGHADALAAAAEAARDAAALLQTREAEMAEQTEDVARLAARHGAAERLLEDSRKTLTKAEGDAVRAREAVTVSRTALGDAELAFAAANTAEKEAGVTAREADAALVEADDARGETQALEAEARARRSEAEGELNALRAEAAALARLLERDTAEGGQVLDLLQVSVGYEKALGAALADDLRAPQVELDGPSGWAVLPRYAAPQALPGGVKPLNLYVSVPDVLDRRMSQIGLVDSDDGPRLQAALKPGQRLVSTEGDLWRWDGFRAWAEDAPSAAALRLQQLNRLEELKQALEQATQKAEGAQAAHERLIEQLADLTKADAMARDARRAADRLLAEAGRALSKAEADRNLAQGKLEALGLAVTRHEEEAMGARTRLKEAERALADLDDLVQARDRAEAVRVAVEAARITMMTRRSEHDELRRVGEAREKRTEDIAKELAGWRTRLETAEKRSAELVARKDAGEAELSVARAAPEKIQTQLAGLDDAKAAAEARQSGAADRLAAAETEARTAVAAERDAERLASDAREARARAETRADAAKETVALAVERIADENQLTPSQLLAQIDV